MNKTFMKKYILISTDKFCHLILAVLGVEGENDGFINDGKLKKLCYIIKKDFDRIDFRKFAELRDLGIDGEIGKDNDELKDNDSIIIDIKADVNTGISLLDEDLRIIAMIGCFMNIYVVASKMLRIKLTF